MTKLYAFFISLLITTPVMSMDTRTSDASKLEATTPKKAILFRFSNVVVPPSLDGFDGLEGIGASLMALTGSTPASIRKNLFQALENVTIELEQGKPIDLVQAWLTIPGSSAEIKTKAVAQFWSWQPNHAAASATFTPSDSVQAFHTPTKSIIEVFNACKKQGYNVYACDDFNDEFLDELTKKHPNLFSTLNGIHISGSPNVGALMTNEKFYTTFSKINNIDLAQCTLVDTDPDVMKAAKKAGVGNTITYDTIKKLKTSLGLKTPTEDTTKN